MREQERLSRRPALVPGQLPEDCLQLVVFFFSSRRRHTRLVSDWSSDVCSSDLRLEGWNEGHDAQERDSQKVAPFTFHLSILPSFNPSFHHFDSSFTAYPACVRRTAGEPPPGHNTMRPPATSTYPPNHTHQTSGLIVNRYTACSVPFTRPPSTT